MAEIDKLEIKIAADASDAASKIKDLASSLNQLGQSSIGGSASQLTELSTALSNLKNIKSLNGLNETISQISAAVSAINKIPVTGNYKNIVEMFSGLSSITDSIKNLKVNQSFETNLDNLASAMQRLNEIGNTSSFADGVSGIEQAIERINNIEIGQGFTNLLQATSQFENAITSANDFRLSNNFVESAIRVARSAEILNDVDFSGFERMNKALGELPDNVRVSFGASSDEISGMSESIGQVQSSIEAIGRSLDNLASRKKKVVEDTANAQKEIAESANSEFTVEPEKMQEVNFGIDPSVILKYNDELEGTASAVRDVGNATQTSRDSINRFVEILGKIGQGSAKIAATSIKAVMAPLSSVGARFSAAAKKAGEFLSSIKRIAMYRAIRSVVKAITDGFAEGRKNLYYYSQAVGTDFAPSMDKAATAALYLKNSIGAATAPLTNYLVPIIDRAVDHVVDLINKFNELTAVLTGASTWTRALKYPTEWQDALDDANASAKKLKSTMLGFDELNVIEPNTHSSKSKALDAEDYSKMFEEMVTSASWRNAVPDVLLPVKLAWDAEGDNTLQIIKQTWNDILRLLDSVRESFRTVWMNGTGQKTLELILQITQNIVGTFGSLAKNIKNAWDEGEKGTFIIQKVWDVANNLLTVFRDIWGSIREWADNLDWNPLISSLGGLFDAVDKLTNPESGAAKFIKDIYNDILLPIGKWIVETGAPKLIDLSAAIIRLTSTIIDNLYPVWKWIDENLLQTSGKFTGSLLSVTIDALTDFINILDKLANGDWDFSDSLLVNFGYDMGSGKEDFWDTWTSGVKDIFPELSNGDASGFQKSLMGLGDSFYDLLHPDAGSISFNDMEYEELQNPSFFKEFGDNWVTGWDEYVANPIKEKLDAWETYWSKFGETCYDKLSTFWNDIKDGWEVSKGKIHEWWEGVKRNFNELLDFPAELWKNLKNKFSEEWDLFLDGLNVTFGIKNNSSSSMKKYGKDIINGLKNGITDGFSKISSWIKTNIFDPFVNGVKNLFNINSPSKVTEEIGSFITDGLLNGIAKKFSVTEIVGWIREHVYNPFINGVKSTFGINTDGDSTSGKSIGESVVGGIKSGISGTISGISSLFTKNDFEGYGTIINEGISDGIKNSYGTTIEATMTERRGWIKGLFSQKEFEGSGENIDSGISTGVVNNYDATLGKSVLDGFTWIKDLFAYNNFWDVGKGIMDGMANGINENASKLYNAFHDAIQESEIPEGIMADLVVNFKQMNGYASGGIPETGELFIAREAGAELVGRFGNHTGVANNQQIVAAVSDGVYRAVSAAMAQQGTQTVANDVHIYLDRQEITSQVEQQQKANGVSIFSPVVYT